MSLLIILLVVLIFGLLVFVHELGHFWAARRSGVEVEEFGFGFPPRVWGRKWGPTVYSINALPLGGFVKLKGETLTDKTPGSFGAASFWSKTKILFAGVTMNALTAYLILVWLCITGLPPVVEGLYSHGQPTLAQPKRVMAVVVEPGSPAQKAGIERGDFMLEVNGQPLKDENELLKFTKAHAGSKVEVKLLHDGRERVATPTLRGPDQKNGYLGVTPVQTYKQKYGLVDALITAAGITLQLMWLTLVAFGSLIANLFVHGQPTDNVAGPVGIVAILANIVDFGWAYVLVFVASISISLAVVNALPLPALDGGRWLLAAVQRVTGKSLTERTENLVHLAGFSALILLLIVVTVFDIKRLG